MRSRGKAARVERRLLRRLDRELAAVSGTGDYHRRPSRMAKDVLGAAMTLAIIGAILLQVTDGLASRCRAGLNAHARPGGCSGMAAIAHHAQPAVTLGVSACAALAVTAFTWYMLRGYGTRRPASGTGRPSLP